jgi:hypothetical protein
MPVVDMIKTSAGNLLFYDVEASVGRNGVNHRLDVLLVQFLLGSALREPTFASATPAPVTPTGVPDQPTLDGIDLFQTTLNRRNRLFSVVDGRIDPVPGDSARVVTGGPQYGIVTLNISFEVVRPGDLARLVSLPDCPTDLRSILALTFVR